MQPWQPPMQPMQQIQPIQGLQPFGSVQSRGQLVPSAPMHMPPQYVSQPIQMPPPPPQIIYYPQLAPTNTQQPQMNTLKQKGKDKEKEKQKEVKKTKKKKQSSTSSDSQSTSGNASLKKKCTRSRRRSRSHRRRKTSRSKSRGRRRSKSSHKRQQTKTDHTKKKKEGPNHRSIHQKLQVLPHNGIPMILNGTHGAIGVPKIRALLNLNLGNSRTIPLGMIPPDPKDIDRITDLINPKELPKDRNKEEETTKEEEKAGHSPRAKAYLQKEMQGQYILLQLMLIHLAVEAIPSPVVMNSKKNKSQMTHFGVPQSTQL